MHLINAELTNAHAEQFYNLRYFPDIHNNHTKHPTLSNHMEWFKKQDMKKMFLLCDNWFAGYIRIDADGYISLSVYEKNRRRGCATFMVREIIAMFDGLNALIKRDNVASIALFSRFPEVDTHII